VRIGVVTFPGSLDDADAARAVRLAGHESVALWHGDADLRGVDAVVLPGGFSYGDYLRCGAISRFAPVMTEVIAAAGRGMPVLGICNGFQILCESHLLPGALTRNDHRRFVCRDQRLRIENVRTPWTSSYAENAEVHGVRVFSMRNFWSLQTNLRWSLRISAPGSRWDSQRIWKPLQIPRTGRPLPAASITSVITGENREMAPHRR
jgi:GMP synthase-like glutamine amidotransferase